MSWRSAAARRLDRCRVRFSDGALNPCPDKPKVLGEVWRILKPGGRLRMVDILLEPHATPAQVARRGSWPD
jgi:ubiquinone/menaquinone biosynthesis C-methylase UbiE